LKDEQVLHQRDLSFEEGFAYLRHFQIFGLGHWRDKSRGL
jgi:hypothetical protein